jgi:hypothetical protein
VDIADNDQRSLTVAQIVEAYNTGVVTAETYVWREGMGDWEPLAEVPEINQALHAAASAPAPRLASTEVQAAAAGSYAGSSLLEPRRAATRGDVGRDLFGGIDVAGSELDTRTGAAEHDASKPATGARNESSVLFSLSALTSGPDKAGASGSGRKDDSGLIDLAALAALQPRHHGREDVADLGPVSAPMAAVAPLGGAPLGVVAPPLGSVEVPKAPSGNRGAMFIGGGIAIAAIVASLAYVLKEDPPAVTVAAAPVASAAAVSAEVPAEATSGAPEANSDGKSAAQTATESGKDKPAANPGKAPQYKPRPANPKPAAEKPAAEKPAAKPAAESGDKPAATPPKKKCNCAPSDLMCAMRCSAK